MTDLLERRAKFIYEGARIAAIAQNAPIVPASWEDREEPFKKQFIEIIAIQCSEKRSSCPEDLHNSWMEAYFKMGWKYGIEYDPQNKIHPDLVPFSELQQQEQDKDAIFVALCEIARKWIYKE